MSSTPSMQDLLEAGVHFGHKVSRGNPRMKDYIFGARDGVHIIDLEKSEAKLKEAIQAAHNLGQEDKTLLIVGTKKQAQEMVKELAESVGAYYIHIRWPGGLLTNFDELRKNFQKLVSLKEQQQKGELSLYTKKEQLLISKKLEKFERDLGGVVLMDKLPNVLLVIDAVSDLIAVKEARRMGLTIIGLCDSNADPTWFDFPVPANDDGIKSIKIIAEALVSSFKEGKSKAVAKAKVAEESKKKAEEKKAAQELEETPVIAAETAAIEEEVEKKIVKDSERIV